VDVSYETWCTGSHHVSADSKESASRRENPQEKGVIVSKEYKQRTFLLVVAVQKGTGRRLPATTRMFHMKHGAQSIPSLCLVASSRLAKRAGLERDKDYALVSRASMCLLVLAIMETAG
jgi:hypothetical protein